MSHILRTFATTALALLIALPALASDEGDYLLGKSAQGSHKLSVGARYHDSVASVHGLPMEQGDVSWLLAYEYHENIAFWQIGVDVAPSSSTDNDARVITPQLSLIFKDGIFRLGAGVLQSYVELNGESEWTDLYWQTLAGVDIPLGSRLSMGVYGCYVFHKWGEISKTDENGIAGNLLLSWAF